MEFQVELGVGPGDQIEAHAGKKIESPESRLRCKKLTQTPRHPRRKRERAIENKRVKFQGRVEGEVCKLRPARTVPVFERGFEIVFKKIDRREKRIGVVVQQIDG